MEKLILFLIFSLSIVLLSRAQDELPPKLKEGFRDLSFGMKLSNIDGLIADSKFDDYIIYKRPADILKLGDTSLDSISYDFWDGKLAMVSLNKKTTLLSNSSQDIDEFLTSLYGKPTEIKRPDSNAIIKISQETWEDDKTSIIYTVMTSSPIEIGEIHMSIVIKSKEIDSEKMKAKAEINSSSPNGL
jgi:hypothetical protein